MAFYMWWSLIVSCAIFYNIIFVIGRTVFTQLQKKFSHFWFFLDYFLDLIYVADMLVSSRIGYIEKGMLIIDPKSLRQKYIWSWKFVLDVLSIFPTDFLYIYYGNDKTIVRINRLLKTWRMSTCFEVFETLSSYPNVARITKLLVIIAIIIHWNACFYFSLSGSLGYGSDQWVYPNASEPGFSDLDRQYLYCLWWSVLTIGTIGDINVPVRTVSFIYTIAASFLGLVVFVTIFGNIGAMIINMNATKTAFQLKINNVKQYMKIRGVHEELQHRVIKWMDYTWKNQQLLDDESTLEALPCNLRTEIAVNVHLNTLRQVRIFKDCDPGLLTELVTKLKLKIFSPGDYICRKGDIGREMFIVKSGSLQVVSDDEQTVFSTLEEGVVFGELSILDIPGNITKNKRTANVRSVGYTDVFCLSKNDLLVALEAFPDAKEMLMKRGMEILRKDYLLDEEMARKMREAALDAKIIKIAVGIEELQRTLSAIRDKMITIEYKLDKASLGIMTAHFPDDSSS